MSGLKKILCCVALLATLTASPAFAWHGHGGHGFGGHYGHGYSHGFGGYGVGGYGFGGYGFTGHNYGFGLNHHSFRPSIYNPGWSSYSRASFYGSYGYGLGYGGWGYGVNYGGLWPRTSFYYRSYAPVYYTNYSYYTPTYYVPTYYVPTCTSTYITPVIYSSGYSGFTSCATTPTVNAPTSYTVSKPVTSGIPLRLASQPIQSTAAGGRFVAAQASNAALDTAPEELISAADAILAAGGYRQAAQAYAQIVVKYGNSDRLVTRRFIAQVANGDLEQAGVVVDLAIANGNQINMGDVPQADLRTALGDTKGLIAIRSESLAASALQKSDDPTQMLTLAHWLALSGDTERADLFKARAEQMQQVTAGKLTTAPLIRATPSVK